MNKLAEMNTCYEINYEQKFEIEWRDFMVYNLIV